MEACYICGPNEDESSNSHLCLANLVPRVYCGVDPGNEVGVWPETLLKFFLKRCFVNTIYTEYIDARNGYEKNIN